MFALSPRPAAPWLLFLTALGALALAAGCKRAQSGSRPKTRPPPSVVAAKVVARDVPVEVQAPVDLRPLEQVDVGSKVLGYVDAVLVERGDRVKKGQIVALVRPSDLPDQLAAARSSIGQIKAQAALARTNYERASKLAPSGVVSQQELQAATAALASAEAAEAAMQAQISGLAIRLGETRITSPIAGWVSARRLDPGALVSPSGGAIVTVMRMDKLRVFLSLTESDAVGIAVGMDARVELDALPGRDFSGKVVRLAPAFDPLTRTLDAEVQLDNESGQLRPGMYGRGFIRKDLHPLAPVVPVNAVQISEGRRYVFVLRGARVERREITTGVEIDGGKAIEVRSGLAPGEEVVMAGADGLADGTTVRVTRGVNLYTGVTAAAAPQAGPKPKTD
ncbi:MAG: efflux RND transporter periplasmic adaptor subunit [Deltaproteobacteria bacterium]|jgi:RND family efflux transporter MFP subunit|nr:efflux RND transporter periplasmic adaptor subunit [Deltaproteobacteria bacterium]